MKKILALISILLPEVALAVNNQSTENTEGGLQELFSMDRFLTYFSAMIVLLVGVFMAWVVKILVLRAIEKSRGDYIREATKILVGRVVFVTISFVSIAICFAMIGIDMWTVFAALGLGIGFAFKDIIGNFMAGVVILMQEKINIGDLIRVGLESEKVFGTVMDITGRATIIHAFNGTEIIVPNADIIAKQVTCFNTNPFRRIDFAVGISFGSDIEKARQLALEAMKNIEGIEVQPAPSVIATGFLESAVEIKVRFWVQSRSGWLKVRTEVIRKVKEAFDQNGIVIPFPIRTIQSPAHAQDIAKEMHDLNRQKFEQDRQNNPFN